MVVVLVPVDVLIPVLVVVLISVGVLVGAMVMVGPPVEEGKEMMNDLMVVASSYVSVAAILAVTTQVPDAV